MSDSSLPDSPLKVGEPQDAPTQPSTGSPMHTTDTNTSDSTPSGQVTSSETSSFPSTPTPQLNNNPPLVSSPRKSSSSQSSNVNVKDEPESVSKNITEDHVSISKTRPSSKKSGLRHPPAVGQSPSAVRNPKSHQIEAEGLGDPDFGTPV